MLPTHLFVLLCLLSSASFADAYKCRDADNRIVFTDSGCPKGSKTERIQTTDVIVPEQKNQTEDLNARTQRRLLELQREKAVRTNRQEGMQQKEAKEGEKASPTEEERNEAAKPENAEEGKD